MKHVLIVDTETTGLSPADGAVCVEVGAILFNVEHRAVVNQLSFVLPCLFNEAEHINHIPPAITTLGCGGAIALLEEMLAASDAVIAHNAEFDRQWFGIGSLPPVEVPWVCTMSDVSWPKELRLKSRTGLAALALAHGVPVWAAHRALTDCVYLAQVFERCDDLAGLLEDALKPKFTYQAMVGFDDRQLAKDAGFSWNTGNRKCWTKKMSESELAGLPFAVQRLD